ncbi:unnamed protein product [Penicillium salamii]|uniref:Anaphase-promoting complex subunit 4 WD40 domain-containing protein n=1 Tax=Penicillium salamii TaxID=1612424 RepID=A0A9W4NXD9_9EURO|nr:unnamed protein product [Penicillium salamii]CAG8050812.1 unnamed protein product [Penicillium salamii]CAG8114317.1 unnamed protein product [Penicillium salamii]CAG8147359.1 unnamed protein product [Penicillium salamii]CAG8170425.1 unnamed protein product [Penicillium salamii]
MVDTSCHSFEEASPAENPRTPSFVPHSPFSSESGSIRITDFATVNLPFFESPVPKSRAKPYIAHSKDNRGSSPERGRYRLRAVTGPPAGRSPILRIVSPDRFIPRRDFTEPKSAAFRVAKPSQQLSPRERLFRRLPPGYDPFLPANLSRTSPGVRPIGFQRIPSRTPHLVTDFNNFSQETSVQNSLSTIWNLSGASESRGVVPIMPHSGSPSAPGNRRTAPNFVARFLPKNSKYNEDVIHESRLALALGIDLTNRLLENSLPCPDAPLDPTSPDFERLSPFVWKDNAWKKVEREHWPKPRAKMEPVPSKPFRILDAPFLKDDFYCSTLAYSPISGILAVGLCHQVYLWSESRGVDSPPFGDVHPSNYVTSLSFSSEDGEKSILAVARRSGQLTLWSTFEQQVRFEISHPNSITCVAWKPKTARRFSERLTHVEVDVEELVAGDELGIIWYYSVEWSSDEDRAEWKWNGSMTLLAKICAHTEQICGLTWSPDLKYLATGGNDNACLLFDMGKIVPQQSTIPPITSEFPTSFSLGAFPYHALGTVTRRLFQRRPAAGRNLPSWVGPPSITPSLIPLLSHAGTLISGGGRTILVPFGRQKYRLYHSAAVKAIAFAPWQSSLLATGGGSNDRAIHFFHTRTGACLATINVFAQVTSLIWSQTRREIVATFGYAQPDHPFRIAVFAWPSCAQIAVVPWGPYGASWDGTDTHTNFDCGRALCAIRYPGKLHRSLVSTSHKPEPEQSRESSIRTRARARTSPERGTGTVRRVRPRMSKPKEKEGGMWCARTVEEGCIIVASSDQTVKFHEVWTGRRTSTGSACGLLGGSDILEGLEGIEKCGGEVIR